jgi:hypothetical protein
MSRLQLLEIEDQPWCPGFLRDAITDFLRFLLETFAPYAVVAQPLADAVARCGATEIVDLCAGGGGPWGDLWPRLARTGAPVRRVHLCDLYPNRAAFARIAAASGGTIVAEPGAVDATAVPARLDGFRTLFTALHHFPPAQARAILADAVCGGRGIGVFEVTRRAPLPIAAMLFLPLLFLVTAPFLRPFRWRRLFWTYVLPVIPVAVWIDGTVSCLRSYTPRELAALAEPLAAGYDWRSGTSRVRWLWPRVTYLIGTPRAAASI